MRTFWIALLCAGMAACLAGCGGSGSTADQVALQAEKTLATATYLPLTVGNKWVYSDAGLTATARITGMQAAAGQVWYKETYTSSSESRLSLFRHATGGLWQRVGTTSWLIMKAPVARGTTWNATDSDGHLWHYSIISTNGTVTVPAGTYAKCVVVEAYTTLSSGAYHTKVWYFPNVGVVKSVDSLNSTVVRISLLKSVTLK